MYSINFINEVFEKKPKFTGTPITKIPQISDCQKSTHRLNGIVLTPHLQPG